MTNYQYIGPVTAITLNSTTMTLVPQQQITLDEDDDYVIRLVERGHLIAVGGV